MIITYLYYWLFIFVYLFQFYRGYATVSKSNLLPLWRAATANRKTEIIKYIVHKLYTRGRNYRRNLWRWFYGLFAIIICCCIVLVGTEFKILWFDIITLWLMIPNDLLKFSETTSNKRNIALQHWLLHIVFNFSPCETIHIALSSLQRPFNYWGYQ